MQEEVSYLTLQTHLSPVCAFARKFIDWDYYSLLIKRSLLVLLRVVPVGRKTLQKQTKTARI